MKYVTVCNTTRNVELGRRVRVAATLMDRAVGLLSTPALGPGEGVYLRPCKSIHTLFMRYPIDVFFLDDRGAVICQETVRPWRISSWQSRSRGILEMAQGTIARSRTQVGDLIELKGVN